MALLQTLRFILGHPLNQERKTEALLRYVRWQIGSRILPGPVAVPFVDQIRLLVAPGMTGATGNLYCGLHEFEDMAFTLRFLRPGDLFVDIGANVGSYSLLAAAAGARSIAFEPVPSTFKALTDNIRLNGLSDQIDARQIAIGARRETLIFTSDEDTMNHVAGSNEEGKATVQVDVQTLDEALGDQHPILLKIDVEGFESNVLEGGHSTLESTRLLAVILELNGSGRRYGFEDADVHGAMLRFGFAPYQYHPTIRKIESLQGPNLERGNTLYLRDREFVVRRLEGAPRFQVGESSPI